MNRLLTWGFIVMLLATSCRSESIFDDAVAVWSFSDLNDQAGENSMLKSHGEVRL